jgi:hypothetical protein
MGRPTQSDVGQRYVRTPVHAMGGFEVANAPVKAVGLTKRLVGTGCNTSESPRNKMPYHNLSQSCSLVLSTRAYLWRL